MTSQVEFNEQGNLDQSRTFRRVSNVDASEKGMVGWLIKKGIAKNENIGQIILILISLFFFAMSVLSFYIL